MNWGDSLYFEFTCGQISYKQNFRTSYDFDVKSGPLSKLKNTIWWNKKKLEDDAMKIMASSFFSKIYGQFGQIWKSHSRWIIRSF